MKHVVDLIEQKKREIAAHPFYTWVARGPTPLAARFDLNERPWSTRGALWRKVLLIPTLGRAGLQAPRDRGDAWDRYWRGVRRTGAGGEVLWDGDSAEERAWAVELARRALDPALPVIDVGCGSGRYTRAFFAVLRARPRRQVP